MTKIVSIFLILFFIVTLNDSHARIRVDVTKGNIKPIPIALSNINGQTPEEKNIGQQINDVINNNLNNSGLFKSLPPAIFIQNINSPQVIPHFASWRIIEAEFLLTGSISIFENDINIEFRLWDIVLEEEILGESLTTNSDNYRRIAHIISDKIYTKIIGEAGYFDTKIVYIAERGAANKRKKYLAIMDQDGFNHQLLTDGNYLTLTPRFSPEKQKILYLSYYGSTPQINIYDLEKNQFKTLGNFQGMTFAPRFAPISDNVIFSAENNGNSDIYITNIKNNRTKQLTFNSAIDTSPSYSPDEKYIVFNSDRGGRQQLYVMNSDGGNIRRISFGQGSYSTPVWSPRGDLIAFTKMYNNRFHIGVMRPDGSGERLITESYLDEGPTWSPNGRIIMFTRQQPFISNSRPGTSRIYSIDITGYNLRLIKTPFQASDPAWSPILPLE
ncbi:MAG: Tol-Pal system beta propeller repeat protein TolB [Pseudomonadota bacterium]